MRHFLKFLPSEKRAEAERQYDAPVPAAAKKPLPPRAHAPAPAPAKPETKPKPRRAAPEFGGLIERRKVSRETPAASPEAARQSKPVASKTHASEKSWDTRFDIDSNEIKAKLEEAALQSTGVFLASLDNSAITLADSGLYQVEEEEDEKPKSFNPYDRS